MSGTEFEPMIAEGAAIAVGTVGPDGEPRVTRGWSIRPASGDRLRVAVGADDPIVVANLRDGLVSVTAANVRTFQSVQVKGPVVAIEEPTEDDLAEARTQTDLLFTAIHETDGDPIELLRRFLPHHVVMIELEVTETFDQTPGPEAGAPLGAR